MAKRTALIPDLHCPFADPQAIDLTCQILQNYKPTALVMLGDVVDFSSISKFDTDPARKLEGLQADLDAYFDVQRQLNRAAGTAKRYLTPGNHEGRFEKWLWSHPEVYTLRNFSLDALLRLDELKVHMTPRLEINNTTTFYHGHLANKYSGYTARNALDSSGLSYNLAFGHVHRMGIHYRATSTGILTAVECGWLGDRSQIQYMKGPVVDWQLGMVVAGFDNTGTFSPEMIPYHRKGKQLIALWRDQKYTAK